MRSGRSSDGQNKPEKRAIEVGLQRVFMTSHSDVHVQVNVYLNLPNIRADDRFWDWLLNNLSLIHEKIKANLHFFYLTETVTFVESPFLNSQGCYAKVSEWIVEHSAVLIGVAAGVGAFELIVLIAAIVFCCQLTKHNDWWYHTIAEQQHHIHNNTTCTTTPHSRQHHIHNNTTFTTSPHLIRFNH